MWQWLLYKELRVGRELPACVEATPPVGRVVGVGVVAAEVREREVQEAIPQGTEDESAPKRRSKVHVTREVLVWLLQHAAL